MQAGRFAGLSPNLLGDVVISVETADREARPAGLSFEARVTQLLVHGMLHLFGYDHEHDPAEARRMAAKPGAVRKIEKQGRIFRLFRYSVSVSGYSVISKTSQTAEPPTTLIPKH